MAPLHSPLPWTYDGTSIKDANGAPIMDREKSLAEIDANARLIVLAVNVGQKGASGEGSSNRTKRRDA